MSDITLKEKLNNLPKKPGCYLFTDKTEKIIYIGKAKILRNRVRSYFQESRPQDSKTRRLQSKIVDVDVIVTDSEMEALILEMNLVKEYKPRYNINLKDDKSFPYIRVTKERFPRIFPTRRVIQDGSKYFGPYTDVASMRTLLKSVNRIFSVRSCNYDLTEEAVSKKKYKICLDYHIKKCDGPCEGLVDEAEYTEMIGQVINFINGKNNTVVVSLRERMRILSTRLQFEQAARVRDQIKFIEEFQYRQKIVSVETKDRDILAVAMEGAMACGIIFKVRDGKILGMQHFFLNGVEEEPYGTVVSAFLKQVYLKSDFIPEEIYLPIEISEADSIESWLSEKRGRRTRLSTPQKGQKAKLVKMAQKNAQLHLDELKLQKLKAKDSVHHNVKSLQRDLRLKRPPRRIECFDISNIQGTDPVASMVVFINGRPKKSDYRKFKIRSKQTPDDFAMMAEAIKRRYSGSLAAKTDLPDLILVDGGKGQLSSALNVLIELEMAEQPIAALAKRLDEVYVPGSSAPQNIPRASSGLKILQQIRDEAHRFAITYHRTLRSKRTVQSELDVIPGIGKSKRNALIKYFGAVKHIREAAIDEIELVSGINSQLARSIWNHFHIVQKKEDDAAN